MFDGHCHLDGKEKDCQSAFKKLYDSAKSSGIVGMVLLNLPDLAFPDLEVLEVSRQYANFFYVFPSCNPSPTINKNALQILKDKGAAGLKLHPRLHGYRIDDGNTLAIAKAAGELDLPLMIDCFPDGKNLLLGNTPAAIAQIAEKAPLTRIAVGHAGGHHILDTLMLVKSFRNLYMDLSFSLLYYRGSSVMDDIQYAVNSINGQRVFWGSDYPDRPYELTVKLVLEELNRMNFPDETIKEILDGNVKSFLNKQIL